MTILIISQESVYITRGDGEQKIAVAPIDLPMHIANNNNNKQVAFAGVCTERNYEQQAKNQHYKIKTNNE